MASFVVEALNISDIAPILDYFRIAHGVVVPKVILSSTACKNSQSVNRYYGIVSGKFDVYSYTQASSEGAMFFKPKDVVGKEDPIINAVLIIPESQTSDLKEVPVLKKRKYLKKVSIPSIVIPANTKDDISRIFTYYRDVLSLRVPTGFRASMNCKTDNYHHFYYGFINDVFDIYSEEEVKLSKATIYSLPPLKSKVKDNKVKRKYTKCSNVQKDSELKKSDVVKLNTPALCKFNKPEDIPNASIVEPRTNTMPEEIKESKDFEDKNQGTVPLDFKTYKGKFVKEEVKKALIILMTNDIYISKETIDQYNKL